VPHNTTRQGKRRRSYDINHAKNTSAAMPTTLINRSMPFLPPPMRLRKGKRHELFGK
jgi:hypothetical protein